eukprot:288450-Prymnesium_polylepis.3
MMSLSSHRSRGGLAQVRQCHSSGRKSRACSFRHNVPCAAPSSRCSSLLSPEDTVAACPSGSSPA